jgi:hypothetical protein
VGKRFTVHGEYSSETPKRKLSVVTIRKIATEFCTSPGRNLRPFLAPGQSQFLPNEEDQPNWKLKSNFSAESQFAVSPDKHLAWRKHGQLDTAISADKTKYPAS